MSTRVGRIGVGARSGWWILAMGSGIVVLATAGPLAAEAPADSGFSSNRVEQHQIEDGSLTLKELREAGMRVFTTPFTKKDGFGDGPMNLNDTVSPGGRPTLQGNGTLLRVNGLDAHSCNECHSLLSAATIPPRLGVGGAGPASANAMIRPLEIDPADLADFDSVAGFNGRFANPPFVFGAGGVELLGIEMTEDLQALARKAIDHPGQVVALETKGVSFGTVVADAFGELDTTGVVGIDDDLVVRPFGRKGAFATAREFDTGAMQFHHGMEPTEIVGEDVDADGDGIANEIRVGDISVLHVFSATLGRPFSDPLTKAGKRGETLFHQVGCASCHVPELMTRGRFLPLRFPEDPLSPRANAYLHVDLRRRPARFERAGRGIRVPLFADLKRHDMGPRLAESSSVASERENREFTTARLWGIADTAPYLHDGRATTLGEAIEYHGGDAQAARDAFSALGQPEQEDVLAFLRSLRTPTRPLVGEPGPKKRKGRDSRGDSDSDSDSH